MTKPIEQGCTLTAIMHSQYPQLKSTVNQPYYLLMSLSV